MQDFIKINREDMAAVALKPMKKGMTVTVDDTRSVMQKKTSKKEAGSMFTT